MKFLLVLSALFIGSASAAEVCKIKHNTQSGHSEMFLICGSKEPQMIIKKEYYNSKTRTNHLKLKLKFIEGLIDSGYVLVNENLFIKY